MMTPCPRPPHSPHRSGRDSKGVSPYPAATSASRSSTLSLWQCEHVAMTRICAAKLPATVAGSGGIVIEAAGHGTRIAKPGGRGSVLRARHHADPPNTPGPPFVAAFFGCAVRCGAAIDGRCPKPMYGSLHRGWEPHVAVLRPSWPPPIDGKGATQHSILGSTPGYPPFIHKDGGDFARESVVTRLSTVSSTKRWRFLRRISRRRCPACACAIRVRDADAPLPARAVAARARTAPLPDRARR